MAKAKKKRADKYEEKLAINGTFEDVIGVSVKPLQTLKYKAGDIVKRVESNDVTYTILATKEKQNKMLVPDGMDYVIQKKDSKDFEYVFEGDITK